MKKIMAIKHATPVTVSLHDLQSNDIPSSTLTTAFGPDSLGILVVKDLPPSFPSLRTRVLSSSSRLASLPASTLTNITNPQAKYLVGWSHGVETLRPGVVDTAKGSYYINCAFYRDPSLQGADGTKFPGFEEYTAPNVWPADEDVPGFRSDAEDLIRLIIDTAVLVARACDRFGRIEIDGYQDGYLERVVRASTTTKARLLHYFPIEQQSQSQPQPQPNGALEQQNGHHSHSPSPTTNGSSTTPKQQPKEEEEEQQKVDDSWCTTHVDHGCLTGLTSAMFLDESESESESPLTESTNSDDVSQSRTPTLQELPSSPDPSSGLYILNRAGVMHKVAIPRDCLAFQTGEALELITHGKFKAVPHFVRGVDPRNCVAGPRTSTSTTKRKIARNTLAVFTQPNLDEPVDLETGLTFGEFARGVVKKNTAV
jgi:isopenicillin N synthase-like dioxygenase